MTVDLRTRYLGLELSSPMVASASPIGASMDGLLRLEESGVAAVVLPSLFEEQIEHEDVEVHRVLETGAESFPEALGYFPELDDYNTGPSAYLSHLEEAKRSLSVPVIASLNGVSRGGWIRYARLIEDAGADALELNVYLVAADPGTSAAEVERRYLDLVADVRAQTALPLAVKVGPYFSAMGNMAVRLVEAGADGLVLFNRFLHPDIDLEHLRVVPSVHLSSPREAGLPLRWVALLRDRVRCSIAATSGVAGPEEVLKLLLVGADVTMMASALLRNGPEYVTGVLRGLEAWLEEHEYDSVEQMRGSMRQEASPNPGAFERSQYMRALTRYSSDHEIVPGPPR